MVRKLSQLPKLPRFSFTGFEVLLQSMDSLLKGPVGALLAIARVAADYESYRDSMLLCEPRAAGVSMMSVPFPWPPDSTLTVPSLSGQGQPQDHLSSSQYGITASSSWVGTVPLLSQQGLLWYWSTTLLLLVHTFTLTVIQTNGMFL
ncbi:hypothetical protein SRHO_G00093740 [Serrasalmus rhombeus]